MTEQGVASETSELCDIGSESNQATVPLLEATIKSSMPIYIKVHPQASTE